MNYRDAAVAAAQRNGIPADLFLRQIGAESSWNPDAVSSAGAIGLGQLMPGTAAELGVDPNDPLQNLDGSARYLRQQYDRFGDWGTALAAYNSGPGNVQKYGGIPPFDETRNYVAGIMGDSSGSWGDGTWQPEGSQGIDPNVLASLMREPEEAPAVEQPNYLVGLAGGIQIPDFAATIRAGQQAYRQRQLNG